MHETISNLQTETLEEVLPIVENPLQSLQTTVNQIGKNTRKLSRQGYGRPIHITKKGTFTIPLVISLYTNVIIILHNKHKQT